MRRQRLVLGWILVVAALTTSPARAAPDANSTIELAQLTLNEIMSIPGKQIPEKLLREAQGIAIVPNVVKIGFVAGVRRGHGVVLVKDGDGDWGLPTFVTLTGGSIGWQAGAQASDVVLVFRTRRSIEGLMRGKFTLGADAAVSAGPVGRNVEAATDTALQAEILSYSRSRGLFAGVALDGSAIQTDVADHQIFYGTPPQDVPARVPVGATRLVESLVRYSGGGVAPAQQGVPGPANDARLEKLRQDLVQAAAQLNRILDDNWQKFLALPPEVYQRDRIPSAAALQDAVARYRKVTTGAEFQTLARRVEFTSTLQLLVDYQNAVAELNTGSVVLPPPPTAPTAVTPLTPRR